MGEVKDCIIFYFVIIILAIRYSHDFFFFFTEIATFWKADNMLHQKGEIYHFQK